MKISCAATRAITASAICAALVHVDARHAGGVASAVGPATIVTSAPASAAACASANPILPELELVMPRTGSIASNVGPGRQQHALAGEHLRLPRRDERREAAPPASSMRPSPFSLHASSPVSGRGSRCRRRELRDVALRRGIRPHLAVHRGRDEQRAFAREAQRRQQVVGSAVRELGDEIGGGGRDDDRVGAARDAMWPIALSAPDCHRSVSTGRPDSAWNVDGGDEPRAASVSTTSTSDALLDEQAHELGRLVRGDAAGDAEHDAVSGVVPVGCTARSLMRASSE